MKFRRYLGEDEFDEEFTSPQNRHKHWDKHINNRKEYDMTEEEYEQVAEDLMNTPCDYKKIFGYKVIDHETGLPAYVKYDKDNEFFTAYNEKGKTITAFRRSWRVYNSKMYTDERFEYIDEILRGK